MNILFVLVFSLHAFPIIEKKTGLTFGQKLMIVTGILQPLLDQLLRLFLGETWYQIQGQYFHSLFYSAIFWGSLSLLSWVYWRDKSRSLFFLFPLIGLTGYFLITILTTSGEYFFYPFSIQRVRLGLVREGIIIPSVVILFLLLFQFWKKERVKQLNAAALIFSAAYFLAMGSIQLIIYGLLSFNPLTTEKVNILPQNWSQLNWKIIIHQKQKYITQDFSVLGGKFRTPVEQSKFDDLNLALSVLSDPTVYDYYHHAVLNPVLTLKTGKESTQVKIVELIPPEFRWQYKGLEWRKNRIGQIVELSVVTNENG